MSTLVIELFYFKARLGAVMPLIKRSVVTPIDITNVLFSSGYLTDPVQKKSKVNVFIFLISVSRKCHTRSMFP
jgi:hypothetical protein